jgi:Mg-chelatase subunit ChlD
VTKILLPGLLLLLMSMVARADTIVLADGTRLDGAIVSMDDAFITIDVAVGGTKGRMTIARSDLRELKLGEDAPAPVPAPAPAPAGETAERAAPEGDPTRTGDGEGEGPRVLFLLDASGSMAIGRRWTQATTEVMNRALALPPGARICLVAFHGVVAKAWNGFLRRTDALMRRFDTHLARFAPDLRASTDLVEALDEALELKPDRIVIVSDGISTENHERFLEAYRAVEVAGAHGLVIDTVAVQDGAYTPPDVEDLDAGRALLERLSTSTHGTFTALPRTEDEAPPPSGFRPPEDGSMPPAATVQIVGVESNNVIVPRLLHTHPKFRVRIRDPFVANMLHVSEYRGISWFEVLCKVGDDVFARSGRLELVPENDPERLFLSAPLYIQCVGPEDHRYRTTSNEWRGNEGRTLGTLGPHTRTARTRDYVTLQTHPGATMHIVYHRAGETFEECWFLRDYDGTLPVGR